MSFRPKRPEVATKVRVTKGQYKGAAGTIIGVYDDGVLAIGELTAGRFTKAVFVTEAEVDIVIEGLNIRLRKGGSK